jgi:hypothetical protein
MILFISASQVAKIIGKRLLFSHLLLKPDGTVRSEFLNL